MAVYSVMRRKGHAQASVDGYLVMPSVTKFFTDFEIDAFLMAVKL